jgi:hypothetical protein
LDSWPNRRQPELAASVQAQRYNPKAYRKGDDAMTVTAAEELRANLWPICDSRLELSLPEPALIHGERRNATLVWCRAGSEKHR